MKSIHKLLFTLFILSLSTTLQASDWSKANLDMIDKFAIPAYEALQKSSVQLVKSSTDFCSNADEKSFEILRRSFHQTMDTWQSAQILRSGPAMKSMHFYRLEMWPDRSNAASKHLRKLLKEANPDSLKPEKFARASTAVQGLSALERLIYAKDVKTTDFQTEGKANFKCHLVQAISQNILSISNMLLKSWLQDYREVMSKPSKDNDFFETDKAVAAQFLNDLNTEIQVIVSQKFKRPINGELFRLTKAESWRSQRSLRNITLNLSTSKRLYEIGFSSRVTDKELLEKQRDLFANAIDLGKDLELPLQVAYDKHNKKLQQWISVIGLLKSSINSELPKAIDIPLGFNSLDGD
jgi:predicted lipoprotein